MNRKKIWLTISQAYYCEPEERTEEQNEIAPDGLCSAYAFTINGYNLNHDICPSFLGVMAHEASSDRYWLSVRDKGNRNNDLLRADFAYLLSILTDKEYEELTK